MKKQFNGKKPTKSEGIAEKDLRALEAALKTGSPVTIQLPQLSATAAKETVRALYALLEEKADAVKSEKAAPLKDRVFIFTGNKP